MHVRTTAESQVSNEYGGKFRRLYPWPAFVDTPWGSAWMTVLPGTASTPHAHDEHETFIILSGEGIMVVDAEERPVTRGDVIYLPPFSKHELRNPSEDRDLELPCIWWGGNEPPSASVEI